jgi:hypothetical protein
MVLSGNKPGNATAHEPLLACLRVLDLCDGSADGVTGCWPIWALMC